MEKMKNLGDVCFVEKGVGGTYFMCLVISMRPEGEKTSVGGFKVLISMEWGNGESHK